MFASVLHGYGFTLTRDDLSVGYERGSISPFSTLALVPQVHRSQIADDTAVDFTRLALRTFHDDRTICVYQVVLSILTQKVIWLHGQLVFNLV